MTAPVCRRGQTASSQILSRQTGVSLRLSSLCLSALKDRLCFRCRSASCSFSFCRRRHPQHRRFFHTPPPPTHTSFIGRAYAKVMLGLMRDVLDAPGGGRLNADKSQPLYIVEVGAGHGKFSHAVVESLLRMKEFLPPLTCVPVFCCHCCLSTSDAPSSFFPHTTTTARRPPIPANRHTLTTPKPAPTAKRLLATRRPARVPPEKPSPLRRVQGPRPALVPVPVPVPAPALAALGCRSSTSSPTLPAKTSPPGWSSRRSNP